MTERSLVLEDGTQLQGEGFGAESGSTGEIVFYTGMTGYQEILSDPSNGGQIVMQTYPLAGNYGINRDDFEAVTPFVHGFIAKECCGFPSHFRSETTLHDYLRANGIPGLSGIDTRMLTRHLRVHGTMRAAITGTGESADEALARLRQSERETGLVQKTATQNAYVVPGGGKRIVVMDFGMKHSILKEFIKRGCHVTVVPYHTDLETISRLNPEGILLSNGPGDPKELTDLFEIVRSLLARFPVFGIGLGHQLLALAAGADTEKLLSGHRDLGHPVKDLHTNRVYMTSQNHGYAVSRDSLAESDLELMQISLHDQSVEGLQHRHYPAFSVQYQPESSPGPEDMTHVYDAFLQLITNRSQQKEDVYA